MDDVFIVGAWDDIMEAAVDLRVLFKVYRKTLHFSAGVVCFILIPISRMAKETENLKTVQKHRLRKDAISLWHGGNRAL